VRSDLGQGRSLVHYRCVLRFEPQVQGDVRRALVSHRDRSLTAATAYDELLFHGPCFQVIESIEGLAATGSLARVRATRPSEWLAGVDAERDGWLLDPALVDAAAQMALIWARTLHGQSCLPARFDRVVRCSAALPARMAMEFEHVPTPDPYLVRANVHFVD
jgi:hypothetical protein